MARQFEDATNERLAEVMLTGAPRISRDASSELGARLRGGQDVVSLLPAPEELEGINRRRVLSLMRSALIRQRNGDGLWALLNRQTDNEMASTLLDRGNIIRDLDQQVRENAASSRLP